MAKNKRKPAELYKVRSKINSDTYYTSVDYPTKIIDGQTFMAVKLAPSDSTLKYMLKENMVKVVNDKM